MDYFDIKKACFSGYRPDKLDFKLDIKDKKYNTLIKSLSNTLISLIESGCSVFYCGMAEGFDLICAECIIKLKKKYKNIRLVCVIPFLEHFSSIKYNWKNRYKKVLEISDEVVYSASDYHISAFQIRNKYMVDHSDCVITWYDGKRGGTKNTLKYATAKGKRVINLNTDYNFEYSAFQNNIDLED